MTGTQNRFPSEKYFEIKNICVLRALRLFGSATKK